MPTIDLSILNQRQTPAFYADVFANRPAAGFIGRIFVSTDTFAFYRDNGTGWDLIGGPGTGTITGSGASGQIALWSGASTIAGDTGLTYNGTDNSLTASKFIVTGGTSSQFLKADGSVDSSSYVPYTGATASLNMGANNVLAQNYYVDGNGTNSGGFLGIKQYSGSSSGTNGYTSISALTQNSLYFQFSQTNGTNKTFELSAGLLGTTIRQFQFPDADGTIALTSNIPSVSGAAGQVSYFNGTNSITGSNDLFWDSVNGHLGVNTNVPGTALDVHHDQNTVAILNQTTATNDVRIGFQNNGVGLWRIGAFYNAGANDFGIFDAVGNIQPVTVKKTTGQVLIGTSTVGSGKLVVASATGDNGIQIVGATAPSLRIDSAESGPTKRAGLGISTATNNFIQGSADRDFCIFNGSTAAASPILFGIYDTTNVQEAARISAARNFLVGTVTDSGYKLNVAGTGRFNNDLEIGTIGGIGINLIPIINTAFPTSSVKATIGVANSGFGYSAGTLFLQPRTGVGAPLILGTEGTPKITITSAGNVGIGTNTPTQKLSVYDGSIAVQSSAAGGSEVWQIGIGSTSQFSMNLGGTTGLLYSTVGTTTYGQLGVRDSYLTGFPAYSFINDGDTGVSNANGQSNTLTFVTGGSEAARFSNAQNLLLGTVTDNGQKLQVEGTALMKNFIRLQANGTTSVSTSATQISTGSNTYGGLAIVWGSDSGGNIFSDFLYYSLGTFNVLASQTVSGGPAGRTYSVDGSGNLRLTMGSGTYTVRYQALLTA